MEFSWEQAGAEIEDGTPVRLDDEEKTSGVASRSYPPGIIPDAT
jgi:hypothetical protein